MTLEQLVTSVASGGALTGVFLIIAKMLGWIRFWKKDVADVAKDKAEVDVKLSQATIEWAVQLAAQLERANLLNEKRQAEIDRQHEVMMRMREDFGKKMDEMEEMLELSKKECDEERAKNKELLIQLNEYLNGNK